MKWLTRLADFRHWRRPKLRRTFKSRLGRFWIRHPRLKQSGLFSLSLMIVLGGIFGWRLWLVTNRVIVGNNSAAALGENLDPSRLSREGDGRINILLIGVGGQDHTAGDLSDSIMIASLDPLSKELALVSVPRDLYGPILGFGSAKINAAHAYGEQYGYPGGGGKLLSDSLTEMFDIPIHYFIRVDFEGFRKAIDAVGGIEVNIEQAIADPAFPGEHLVGYEPFYLNAGVQQLDGETALKYVRSRSTTSDFDRARRQQQLLLSLKQKILQAGTAFDPFKLNSLLNIATEHARTNINLDDANKLLDLFRQVNAEQIKHSNFEEPDTSLLVDQVIGGVSVLVPAGGDFSTLRRYLFQLMPDSFIRKEGARIKVLNGSGRAGLAQLTADLLSSYGYNVIGIGNHATTTPNSLILDHSSSTKPYTLHYLTKRFKTSDVRTVSEGQTDASADLTIILGQDY